MREIVISLIMMIAAEMGVPPYFALAVALTENSQLCPDAVSPMNSNGSYDRGVMQLNSQYFYGFDWSCPETNIRAGIRHIKWLMDHPWTNTYFCVATAYNAGLSRLEDPPESTVEYANRVLLLWNELDPYRPVLLRR